MNEHNFLKGFKDMVLFSTLPSLSFLCSAVLIRVEEDMKLYGLRLTMLLLGALQNTLLAGFQD